MANTLKATLCIVLISLLATGILIAQSERGTIRGTVTDSTGSVMPGVTVKAVNVATGIETATVTTDSGLYSIPQMKPGTYTVEAERAGFKKLKRENVTVAVSGTVGLDLQLEVGEITQEVSVTTAAPQLKNETSEVSTAINPKTFNDLPLPVAGGRSSESFIFLAPGTTGNTFDAHINGSQTLSKEIQIEGLSMTIAEVGGDPRVVTLPPDALQEFSIATGTYSAEFGNTGGGIERFTIKSGTNKFHGNLYEFLGNDQFDARGFFQGERSIRRQNEYGGSIGGPVIKNKTFFFFNLNYYKFRSGPSNQVASVPTVAFKNGDLSQLKNPDGSLIQIYDPATTRPDGTRDPFPGNIIPSGRISQVSKNILAQVPDPTTPGIVNNYPASGNSRNDNRNYTMKIDHKFNSNHSISGAWNDGLNTDNGPVAPLPLPIANTRDGVQGPAQKTLRLSYDWVINPTTVNHLASGHTRQYQRLESPNQGQDWPKKLGLNGTANGAFPAIYFGTSGIDIGTTSFTNWGQNQELLVTVSNTFLLSDSLSMVKGKHNLKMGVDFRKLQNNLSVPSVSGYFFFNANETALPSARSNTGNGFASFLLGAVDNGSYTINEVTLGMRYPYFAAYVQDDIKLRPNFTLNLGLRWDYLPTMVEVNNVYSIMDPTVPNPAAGGRPGALIYAGDGTGRTGTRRLSNGISYNNWGPRIGLAWQPKNHLVVRTGYGISYYPTGAQGGGNAKPPSFGFTATPTFFSQDVGLTPAFYWDSGFPQNFDRPPFISPGFGVGSGTSYWNENAKEPTYRQDWNFGTQYQLAENLLLDVAYVGAKSTRLSTGAFNLNQVDSKYLSLGNLLTQPIDSPAVVAAGFAPPYAGFSGSLAQALRPFPQYSDISPVNSANMGNSTYHSLQMKLEKQFSNGLFLLSSFTWSKTLTDASSALSGFFSTSARDQYNRKLEKALAFSDVPTRLVVAFNYELPIGPGKPHANVTGVAGKILGGWQINGIMSYQSGTPIGVGVNNNLPLFNSRNLPNVVPGVNPKFDTSNFDPAQDLYLDIKAFAEPAPFTYGNAASVTNIRTFPNYNEDFGIMKRTYIREQMNIELRFEMFNAFNRHIFGAPASSVSDPFSFGKVTSASGGRQGQFALKFNF